MVAVTCPDRLRETTQNSSLLSLPSELRNTIYELVLVSEKRIKIYDKANKDCRPPAVLQACHQLRHEAGAIYYGGNIFKIRAIWNDEAKEDQDVWFDSCDSFFAQWLASIGPDSRAGLRKVHIHDTYHESEEVKAKIARRRTVLKAAQVDIDKAEIYIELARTMWHSASLRVQQWVAG